MTEQSYTAHHRLDWVDYAKGICIILVVLMHSTYGVERALGEAGQLNIFIAWAQPFRMPDFFLLSGLFLSRRIGMPWLSYIDKKVGHFLYFYGLWMSIQLALKGYGIWSETGGFGLMQAYGLALIEPFGTLWFIYLLPVFFVLTKALRGVPSVLVFALAALLEISPIHTGWIMVDEFAARYVYFFAGYWLAAHVFRLAHDMDKLSTAAIAAAMAIWALVHTQIFSHGFVSLPGIGLILGFVGTGAVVTAGVLLTRFQTGRAIRYLGEHSLVIYLSFFFFMAASRTVALRVIPTFGPDMIALGVTFAGIIGPLLLLWLTQGTWASFLFVRPSWATLPTRRAEKLETTVKVWHDAKHDTTKPSIKSLAR